MSLTNIFKHRRGLSVGTLALLAAVLGGIALADELGRTVLKDFPVVLQYHKPPHETQIMWLLHGDEAEPEGQLVNMRGMTLKLFTETGDLQMIVTAPQCIFDTVRHTVYSDGHLAVKSGDGRFSIEGQGFLFTQTSNTLAISNQVLTLLQPESKKQVQSLLFPETKPPSKK